MLKKKLIGIYNSLVNRLSFYARVYQIRRWLNSAIDRPEAIQEFPESHPGGFIKVFRKRRVSIVESYVRIIGFLKSDKCNQRLSALRLLTEHILHSKSLKMPLNTARVQMALMKKAVFNRDNKRIQLECLRDFSVSSFGKPRLIRKYLRELDLIEIPETGQQLKDLHLGWDSHVHDNSSYGRKTPTQLIIDAFIRGISGLTVIYNNLGHIEIINEAIEAGRIMGINVTVGLEFSAGKNDSQFHYIYQFPHFTNVLECVKYLDSKKDRFSAFLEIIDKNQENRIQTINELIHYFNLNFHQKLDEGYREGTIYYLEKLKLSDMNNIIPLRHASAIHLGELLFLKLKPVLLNRVLYWKSQKNWNARRFKDNEIAEWEYLNIAKKADAVRRTYRELNPESLFKEYFSQPTLTEPEPDSKKLEDIFRPGEGSELPESQEEEEERKYIKIIHPLEHGFTEAVKVIVENYKYIGHAEIYTMHESITRDPFQIELFARFIQLLNSGNETELRIFLEDQEVGVDVDYEQVMQCMAYCSKHPIIPSIGSDSTGRSNFVPGMGFIFRKDLVKRQWPDYLKKHYTLPQFVSRMMTNPGGVKNGEQVHPGRHEILCMGTAREEELLEVGDEEEVTPILFKQAWRYLHPALKNAFYIVMGFIPAFLSVGWGYAMLWFGITSVRNAITDIISGRGYRPKEWHFKNIDFDNLSHSLFWTGFSVPLLGLVKYRFDLLYPLSKTGLMFEFSQFFFICIINGLYLFSHNTLRGFDRATAGANVFRSLIAWPLAAMFAPVGNLMHIPSIVQAKIWSDFVAGLIEGTSKFNRRIHLRKRDLEELLPGINSENSETRYIAILDLLYFFKKDPRTRNSLKFILFKTSTLSQKLLDILRRKKRNQRENVDYYSYYDILLKWFDEPTHFFQLIDFILEHYKQEQSVYLTHLVSVTFYDFVDWLQKLSPHRGKKVIL